MSHSHGTPAPSIIQCGYPLSSIPVRNWGGGGGGGGGGNYQHAAYEVHQAIMQAY